MSPPDSEQCRQVQRLRRRRNHAGPHLAAEQLPDKSGAAGSRRTFVALASAAATILLIGVVALTWRPWATHRSNSPNTSALPTSIPTLPMTSSPLPPAPSSPLPPPSFSPNDIDQVLLTDDQLSRLVGTTVTDNPAGGGAGGLALESSSYGTADHSGQVTPRSCVGVVFTGEHDV